MKLKKYAFIDDSCVACGTCADICPLNAITIYKGIIASVNKDSCVGCGKCERICPAGIIEIQDRDYIGDLKGDTVTA